MMCALISSEEQTIVDNVIKDSAATLVLSWNRRKLLMLYEIPLPSSIAYYIKCEECAKERARLQKP